MDAAINCIGINIRKPSLKMTEEDWDRVLDVNLKGAFFFAQCAARTFIQQRRRGKIISIASILSFSGMEDRAPYGASKTGLVGLTKALAVEWAPYNINVNAVAPTFIPTSMNRETLAGKFKQRRERSFRILIRFDGQCTLDKAVTPEHGLSLSPVATLGERS
jgi:NAD(P)-dependent dehydrogenase (short-subunit alcohol dehydrogenase family)